MTNIKQAVSATLVVLLTLTALASVRPDVALGAEGHDEQTTTTAPTPDDTDAETPTTEPAPAADAETDAQAAATPEGQQLVAESPSSDSSEARTAPAAPRSKRDPRLINFRKCRAGFWTCAIAKMHQDRGKYLWRNGKVFTTWDGRRVRGHRGQTWTRYQREARQLVAFFKVLERAQREQSRRDRLVRRWSGVARCESGGRWSTASGNGYYGGLQFSLSTWRAFGGTGYPNRQPAWKQAEIAERLRVRSGLHHWPHCGRYYG